ncbi:MAG: hypothetical protein RRB13_12455 [bacterium]|nr:hypothetical protein [bacterium]
MSDIEKAMKQANQFDLDFVARKHSLEYGVPLETVRTWIPELKHWLVLCAVNPDSSYTLFGRIDWLWHSFIEFTIEYRDFCMAIAGRPIEHVPDVPTEEELQKIIQAKKIKQESVHEEKLAFIGGQGNKSRPNTIIPYKKEQVDGYAKLLKDYKNFFPDKTPHPDVWPRILKDGYIDCPGGCCGGV